MTSHRVRLGIIFAATVLICHAIWAAAVSSPSLGSGPTPAVDLYGNEVEPAVGEYRIDDWGGVYESHSPEVAVQRLPPPVS